MASNKKGTYSGTGHLFGSYWGHLGKDCKKQFWKKERRLTGLDLKTDEEKVVSGPKKSMTRKAIKQIKKQKQTLKEHNKILRTIERRAREQGLNNCHGGTEEKTE